MTATTARLLPVLLAATLSASHEALADPPPSPDVSANASPAPATFQYVARVPPGFVSGRRQANGMVDLGTFGVRSPAPGEIAWFASNRFQADVVVSTLDASPFAAHRSDPGAWAHAVIAAAMNGLVGESRADPNQVTDMGTGPEDPAAGLTASVARRYANRTGDTDVYVRFVERDGTLFRVVLRVWGTRTNVQSWITAFLDRPFGITRSPLHPFGSGRRHRPPRPANNQ